MRRQDQFRVAARAAQGRSGKAAFGASATGKNKFAAADGHAMKLRRIIEAEQAALHGAAGGEFREYRGEMTASALDAAGRVQFRKYANEHWVSLPSVRMERKREAQIRE